MSITEEESNFLRFYFLNLKVASESVRVYFDYIHPSAGLAGDLARSYVTLKGLRFITKQQLNILYPNPTRTVTSAEFDTTLIVSLLRNMTPRESAPVTGFDNVPHPGDTSTGADIARVKWYRNKLVHSEDGKLSPADFSQFWGDLEGAIGRLGGSSMLKEAQSAQHIVLDKSLEEMLKTLRNTEKDVQNLNKLQEKHTDMINDLQTAIENQKIIKEQHENKIRELHNSFQKRESTSTNLLTEISKYKGTIDKCTEEIEAWKKVIEKNEETIKGIQGKVVDKQHQVDNLTHQLFRLECKYDKNLKEIDEKLVEHDKKMTSCVEEIDNLKKTDYHTDDTSGGSKQKRFEEDTRALIEEDVREGTFVSTKAVTDGLLLLKQHGVLLITGYAGTGKSRIGRHVLHMFCTENKSLKCIKLTLAEWENLPNKKENLDNKADFVVLLFDDIFGETNFIYNREKDTPVLDKVHEYVCKGKTKVIVTIRDTVKRQCQNLLESHRLFQYDFIDLSSKNYVLSQEEKHTILTRYMKTVQRSDFIEGKGYVDCNGDVILKKDEVSNITRENPVKGFPLVVYQFVHNYKYFKLGKKFFDRPTEAMLEEMNAIRRKGEDDRKFMIQYAVVVYTAINENCIKPDDSSTITEIAKVIDAIYGVTTNMKECNILDAVKELKGSYLVNIPNQRSYRLHHPTIQESVILSFAQTDEENINKIIPLISWSFFLKMVKPELYKEKEGEVVLRVRSNSYKLLADRLADFGIKERGIFQLDRFINNLCNTEIFKHEYRILLPCLLEAFEKKDDKDKYTENMIRCNEWNVLNNHHLLIKIKYNFLATLLNALAQLEKQLDTYCFVLKILKTLIKTSSHHLSIHYMISALISTLYALCSTEDVRSVKATLDIIEEHNIPVLLDQGVIPTNIRDISTISVFMEDWDKGTCVLLTVCIWRAYAGCNIPVLEFLLSKYNQNPFDINFFFKMIYNEKWIRKIILLFREFSFGTSSVLFKPLKWTIEHHKDQKIDDPYYIIRTACKYQMFDTVKYVASKCKSFDAMTCLQTFVDNIDTCGRIVPFNQELFNFLMKKIDITSKELIPVVESFIQTDNFPKYIFDAFLPVCINNANILTLACEYGNVYLVNLIIESSHIEHLDIQSALMAACKECNPLFYNDIRNIQLKKLNIVQYINEKIGFVHFDLKAVCQQACSSKQIKILDWFVENIDTTRLDAYTIIDAALICKRSDILEHIIKNIESLNKRRVLKSVTEHSNVGCFTTISKLVRTIWCSTYDKKVLPMGEIVNTAYERKCFELLMWIHDNCRPHISIDSKKVLMLACEDNRLDVAKWVVETFKQTSLDTDGGELFIKLCSKTFYPKFGERNEHIIEMVPEVIGRVNWILANFQIKQSDIVSGVLTLISVNKEIENDLSNLVVSLLKKYLSCIKTDDIKELINKSIQKKCYVLVNWFLEKRSSFSCDKQMILNNACADQEIETIKILSKYFHTLDMNQAMIKACTSASSGYDLFQFKQKEGYNNQAVACLNQLWKEINKVDHDNIDLGTIVSKVCEGKKVSNNVMTWILLNLPLDKIPINEVLVTCCKQYKIHHVKYIFQEVDNEKLDMREAFVHACLAAPVEQNFLVKNMKLIISMNISDFSSMKKNYEPNFIMNIMIVDYLFQKLHDKDSYVSLVVNELLEKKELNRILYFLREGYRRHSNMKSLLKVACGHGYVRLVQWILENVDHKELDIKSAFHAACGGIENDNDNLFEENEERVNHVMCVALLWHYIHDISMFEIDIVLKTMTDLQSDTSEDSLKTWLLYIKKIKRKMSIRQVLLNTEETIHQQSEQVNDGQCCLENSQDSDDSNSSYEHPACPSPIKKVTFDKQTQT